MANNEIRSGYPSVQVFFMVLLRIFIGWHFLYEGITKLLNPNWTSIGYLMDSKGFLSGFFQSLAQHPTLLKTVEYCNIWGLIAIGLGLVLGCFSRLASFAGILLLLSYFLSHPPFIGYSYMMPSEGNYLFVDKNLIEIFALAVIMTVPTGRIFGFDRIIYGRLPN